MWARFRDESNTRVTSPLKAWTPQSQDSSTSGANSCLLKSFWAFSYLTLQRCHLKNERKTDPAKELEKQKEKFCASECLHRLLPKLLDSMFTLTDMFLHISASVYLLPALNPMEARAFTASLFFSASSTTWSFMVQSTALRNFGDCNRKSTNEEGLSKNRM